MPRIVNDAALDTLFRAPRSRGAWLAKPVNDTMLRALWELVKHGPTSGHAGAGQILFVRSALAKARLVPAIAPAEQDGVATAPIAAIIACRRSDNDAAAALCDGALQAAYLIIAARALGLDCGPIWHFDARLVDAAFFPEGALAARFLCAIGYGDDMQPSPQPPPLGFDEACQIL